jgi:arylsulfatase A-like enzyme
MTLATHGSLFTGLYPVVHGAHYRRGFPDVGAPLADSHTTLSELLAAQGYNTAAIAANSGYLTSGFGFSQGFAYYDARPADPFLDRGSYFGGGLPRYSLRWKIRRLITNRLKPRQYEQISRRAEEINREAYRRLDVLKKDRRPFFLFLNYMDAHTPYIPPRPFDTRYPGVDDGISTPYILGITQHLLKYGGDIPMRLQRHIRSQYDGGISYIDYEIGKLIAHLKSVGLYDNSMIVITADHGEALGEHNMLDHGTSVYNEQVKIPLIIRFPRNKATARGQVQNEPASSVDVLPTVLETLGLPIPANLNGLSLLNKPNSLEERPVFSESYRKGPQGSDPARNAQRAVVFRGWKLVADPSGRCELYSLHNDTNEATNLCGQEPDLSKNLIGMLRNLTRPTNSLPEKQLQLDKQTLDRLRSLGYIQ